MNFVFGYGENGFSADIQRVVGLGAYAGANGGFSINLEVSDADNVDQLCGLGFQAGGEGPMFIDANVFGGEGYMGYSIGRGIGGGPTPGAGYGYITNTSSFSIMQWLTQ